jgi:hypothetical protein
MKRTCRRYYSKGGGAKRNENIVRSGNIIAYEFHEND